MKYKCVMLFQDPDLIIIINRPKPAAGWITLNTLHSKAICDFVVSMLSKIEAFYGLTLLR